MEEIRSIELTIDWKEILTLNLPLNGSITITKAYSSSQWKTDYKIEVISNQTGNTIQTVELYCTKNLENILCGELIRNNIYARNIEKEKSFKNFIIKFSFTNPYIEILDKLKAMKTYYETFSFSGFVNIKEDNLIVRFKGGKVGGSYVSAKQRAPGYIEEIESKIGKKTEYLKSESGSLGYDYYIFSIDLNSNIAV